MRQVINMASITQIQTRPNPKVAALIVKNQQVIGSGIHLFAGGHHAEIHALNQSMDAAKGSTLYINLEPCSHYGQTPPCVDAIIKSGISQVIIANLDPNPLVSGRGVAKLLKAGIMVESGICAIEAAQINQIFFHNIQTKRPYVTLKAGLSLDGRIATKTNTSQWITSVESRKDAHNYRVGNEAILVGVNTIITDNPSLTPHLLDNPMRNPIRIILDRKLKTPISSKVVNDKLASTWIYTANADFSLHKSYQDFGVKIIYYPELTIDALLDHLYKEQIYTLLVEGGERIYSSFIEAKAVNQIITYFSPQLIGSKAAKHLFAGNGFDNLQNNPKFKFADIKQLGTDIKIVSEVIPESLS